jgi:N-acetylglucosamine-6-sulfatase
MCRFVLSLIVVCCGLLSAAEKPNIVFLFSDDHALAAISAYGSHLKDAAPTPNLDRIA